MSYEFNRSYSILFFIWSTIVFFLNLIAISIDEWTKIDGVKKGLWRNTTVQMAPEFYGLEVERGMMVVTLVWGLYYLIRKKYSLPVVRSYPVVSRQ